MKDFYLELSNGDTRIITANHISADSKMKFFEFHTSPNDVNDDIVFIINTDIVNCITVTRSTIQGSEC